MDIKKQVSSLTAHKKKIIGGGVLAALVFAFMGCSGCVATYDHRITGSIESGLHEQHRAELQTDDFIIEMRKLDMEEMKLKAELK